MKRVKEKRGRGEKQILCSLMRSSSNIGKPDNNKLDTTLGFAGQDSTSKRIAYPMAEEQMIVQTQNKAKKLL